MDDRRLRAIVRDATTGALVRGVAADELARQMHAAMYADTCRSLLGTRASCFSPQLCTLNGEPGPVARTALELVEAVRLGDDHAHVFVDGGRYVGSAQLTPEADGALLLSSLCVASERRREGMGTRLLGYVLAAASSARVRLHVQAPRPARGAGWLDREVDERYPQLLAFYKKHGFRLVRAAASDDMHTLERPAA